MKKIPLGEEKKSHWDGEVPGRSNPRSAVLDQGQGVH